MKDNYEQLLRRVENLERSNRDLHSGNTIPLWLDQALNGRGFLKKQTSVTGAFGTQVVSVIGGGGGTVTVPAQPSGTVAIIIQGTIYNLLFK